MTESRFNIQDLIFLQTGEVEKLEVKNYYKENKINYLKVQEYIFLEKNLENEFHKMIVRFLFETAARISEALDLKVKDIDLKYNKVILSNLKQRKEAKREVVISNELLNMMLIHINSNKLEKNDYVFSRVTAQGKKQFKRNSIYERVKKDAYKHLSYDWVTPHTFRHSRAIHLLSEGVDIVKVQRFLGHKSLLNTLIYLQYTNRDIDKSVVAANANIGIY